MPTHTSGVATIKIIFATPNATPIATVGETTIGINARIAPTIIAVTSVGSPIAAGQVLVHGRPDPSAAMGLECTRYDDKQRPRRFARTSDGGQLMNKTLCIGLYVVRSTA